MKFILPLLFVLSVCLTFSQTPQNISASRYILPGVPKITGLTTVKNNTAQKQVWFTERDSGKVGTLVFPRTCGADSAHEYSISGVHPYRVTYAEKAITISDNAARPAKATKHKPTVWFIDYSAFGMGGQVTGRDTIYGLEPAAKKSNTGYLATYPTDGGGITAGEPWGIQWAAASQGVHASIWFYAFNSAGSLLPIGNIYSLEPRASGTTPYGANLTEYSIPSSLNIAIAMHVENGIVWSVQLNLSNLSNMTMSLNMMPVTGSSGFSLPLGSMSVPLFTGEIQPLYSTSKPKANILPNQIWLNFLTQICVISLNPSLSSTAIDTICWIDMSSKPTMALFSDNSKAIPGKWMHAGILNMNSQTNAITSNIEFLRAAPSTTVQRTVCLYAKTSATVNGVVRPVVQTTKNLTYACNTPSAMNDTPTGCLNKESEVPCAGSYIDFTISDFDVTFMTGMSDTKKFDLVANQIGGLPLSSPYTGSDEAAILRVTGKYSPTGSAAGEADPTQPDFTFNQQEAAQASVYELDDAYPNPFNPVTNIQFSLPVQSVVTLTVYNMLGQEVASLLNGVSMSEGTQIIPFDASDLPSGVYFYRITAQSVPSATTEAIRTFTSMKKVVLVK